MRRFVVAKRLKYKLNSDPAGINGRDCRRWIPNNISNSWANRLNTEFIRNKVVVVMLSPPATGEKSLVFQYKFH